HNPLRGRLTRNLIYSTKPGCVCLQPGTLLDTFTPIREDFLQG
ncbi:hypothetical protein ABLV54_24015, partial [Klebsiella sp. JB_Kp042]